VGHENTHTINNNLVIGSGSTWNSCRFVQRLNRYTSACYSTGSGQYYSLRPARASGFWRFYISWHHRQWFPALHNSYR